MRKLIATPLMKPGSIVALEPLAIDVLPEHSYVRLTLPRRDAARTPVELLGTSLPTSPGNCSGVDPVAWWIRPQMWLLASTQHSPEALVEALASVCAGRACAIVDVSDSFVALQVRGPAARELLARATGVDVYSESFAPGCGTRTRFAQLAVLLRPRADDCFELVVDRSAAIWLADWLRSAASTLA